MNLKLFLVLGFVNCSLAQVQVVPASGGPPSENIFDDRSQNCSDYEEYKCVPYFRCNKGTIVTDGAGLIDIRSSFPVLDASSSKCPGDTEVCCKQPQITSKKGAGDVPLCEGDGFGCVTQDQCDEESNIDERIDQLSEPVSCSQPGLVCCKVKSPPREAFTSPCGIHNKEGVGFKVNNPKDKSSTQFGEWPHICAVINQTIDVNGRERNQFTCGCSIISTNLVLTAAHCVQDLRPESIIIRAGEWNTQRNDEPLDHQDRQVTSVIIHPYFQPYNVLNDLAVIQLQKPFDFNVHLNAICLPDFPANEKDYLHKDCFSAGWGKDRFGNNGSYQVILRQVKLDLVPFPECQDRLRKTRLGEDYQLDESFLCAGGESGKDTCKGDGGSPLFCQLSNENRFVQVGIVSWGIGCGEGVPGVYADVTRAGCFVDWAGHCGSQKTTPVRFERCESWAEDQLCETNQKLDKLSKQATKDQETQIEIISLKESVEKLKLAISKCPSRKFLGCSNGPVAETTSTLSPRKANVPDS